MQLRCKNVAWRFIACLALHCSLSQCAKSGRGGRAPKPQSIPRLLPPDWAQAEPYGVDYPGSAYTTFTRPSPDYKIYHNMWFHNQRWYAVLPPASIDDEAIMEDGLSANMALVRMPVADLHIFTAQLRLAYVPGNTALLDFPFQAYYDHLGHWLEMAVSSYNVLQEGSWVDHVQGSSKTLDQAVMPNLSKHFIAWVEAIMSAAFSPAGPPGHSPKFIDYADLDSYDKLGWILYENVIVMQDRYTHPHNRIGFRGTEHGDLWRYDGCDRWVSPTFVHNSFAIPEYGQRFRHLVLTAAGLEPPAPWVPGTPPQLSRHLTLLMPTQGEGEHGRVPTLTNGAELMVVLEELAAAHGLEARMVFMTESDNLNLHLETLSSSAVVVARHSPLLASTAFMPPGSMVLELLPFKWEWHKLSMLYYNMTQSIGDIHHFAWRPADISAAVYKESYAHRYKDWLPGECHAKECLQVQASADLVADLEAVKRILLAKLPGVLAGKSIKELAEPWPEAI